MHDAVPGAVSADGLLGPADQFALCIVHAAVGDDLVAGIAVLDLAAFSGGQGAVLLRHGAVGRGGEDAVSHFCAGAGSVGAIDGAGGLAAAVGGDDLDGVVGVVAEFEIRPAPADGGVHAVGDIAGIEHVVRAVHDLQVGAEHGQIQRGGHLADAAAVFQHGLAAHISRGAAVAPRGGALAEGGVVGKGLAGIEDDAVAGLGCQAHVVLAVGGAADGGGAAAQLVPEQDLFHFLLGDLRLRHGDGHGEFRTGRGFVHLLLGSGRVEIHAGLPGLHGAFGLVVIGVGGLAMGVAVNILHGDGNGGSLHQGAGDALFQVIPGQGGLHLGKQGVLVDEIAALGLGDDHAVPLDAPGALGDGDVGLKSDVRDGVAGGAAVEGQLRRHGMAQQQPLGIGDAAGKEIAAAAVLIGGVRRLGGGGGDVQRGKGQGKNRLFGAFPGVPGLNGDGQGLLRKSLRQLGGEHVQRFFAGQAAHGDAGHGGAGVDGGAGGGQHAGDQYRRQDDGRRDHGGEGLFAAPVARRRTGAGFQFLLHSDAPLYSVGKTGVQGGRRSAGPLRAGQAVQLSSL